MVHTQLWTKQSNVTTNTNYTTRSHVNSFNTFVAIYSNDLTRAKKHDIKKHKKIWKIKKQPKNNFKK